MAQKNKKSINFWFFTGHSIGVTLLGIHALEAARKEFSQQFNTKLFLVLTKKTDYVERMLINYPHITVVILERSSPWFFVQLIFKKCIEKNYFLYPPNFGDAPLAVRWFSFLICRLNGRGRVIAFTRDNKFKNYFFYSHRLLLDLHRNIFLAVAEAWTLGRAMEVSRPGLIFSLDAEYAKELHYKYIVIHPYGSSERRSYPSRYTQNLVDYLVNRYPDYKIIISGGPMDRGAAEFLIKKVRLPNNILFIGDITKNDFSKMVQVISNACLYIGVDTGITHLAAHLRVPSIVLGNLSNPMWLPDYSGTTVTLANTEKCTCTGDKLGSCLRVVDGVEYYSCMVDVPWQTIVSTVNSTLHE